MKINQSETVIIKRSQVNFAPYNPKHHTPEAIKEQKKNFQRVGFLGGIVWNATTGNLISGHKRVMALDMVNGYDGTEKKDYDIKVERIELDDKTEKEQNIYMDARATNTKQDYSLISEIDGIDLKLAGLDDNDLNMMSIYNNDIIIDSRDALMNELDEFQEQVKNDRDLKKQSVKEAKKQYKNNLLEKKSGGAYVTLSFDNIYNKQEFMNMFGFNPDDLFIKGEQFVNRLNENS